MSTSAPRPINTKMRIAHRYLGFFLAGIMAVYALSGIVLIFRKTDFLKKDVQVEQKLAVNLAGIQVGKVLKIRDFKIVKTEGEVISFKGGSYDQSTGMAVQTKKELPFVLNKLTHLHKATTNDPLYVLNIFFGLSLLFFAISSFWMYRPSSDIFKKGVYFTAGGIVLTLILLFV